VVALGLAGHADRRHLDTLAEELKKKLPEK